ncbi:MAG: hypothetical protein ACLU84_00655 [Clostridia bacterium]
MRPSFKQRIHVLIAFRGTIKKSDRKVMDSILKTNYKQIGNSTITYSVNPHLI